MRIQPHSSTTGRLVAVVAAPLEWIERARGRMRVVLAGLLALLLAVAGVFGWRAASLRGLPDPGEPFDVAALGRVQLADVDNAAIVYARAAALFKFDREEHERNRQVWSETDWAKAAPVVRRWVESNREAIEVWRAGADRPESLFVQPEDMTISTSPSTIQSLRHMARAGLLEGSRREQAGDLDRAWAMYRAALRSSRHIEMHGVTVWRVVGRSMLAQAGMHVKRWIQDARVSTPMLRRAIADLGACAAMTPPASEIIRTEYFGTRHALSRPTRWIEWEIEDGMTDWHTHVPLVLAAKHFLRHEPERSLRVLRLIVAGHLAQCDRPPALRPKLVSTEFMIYAHGPVTPASVRALAPEQLEDWAESSTLEAFKPFLRDVFADRERATLELMQLEAAERCYRIEHGKPPKTLAALLGTYLTALPDGFDPADSLDPEQAGESKPRR
jgi:hypothetical protein